jgi:hypothetical protein
MAMPRRIKRFGNLASNSTELQQKIEAEKMASDNHSQESQGCKKT